MKRIPSDLVQKESVMQVYEEIQRQNKPDYIVIKSDRDDHFDLIDLFEKFTLTAMEKKNYFKEAIQDDGTIRTYLDEDEIMRDMGKCIAYITGGVKGEFIVKCSTTNNINGEARYELLIITYHQGMSLLRRKKIKSLENEDITQKKENQITFEDVFKNAQNYLKISFENWRFTSKDPETFSFFRGYRYSMLNRIDLPTIKLFLSHIKNIICNNKDECFYYLMSWFAYIFQHPGRQTQTTIILLGLPGTGKNTFTDTICKLLDSYALPNANLESIAGTYNTVVENKMLVVINEVERTNNKGVNLSNKMKSTITENTLLINPKHKDIYIAQNVSNFIMLTNEKVPIHIEKNDRRYFVLRVAETVRMKFSYFDELYASMNGENKKKFEQNLLSLFLKRDVSKWKASEMPETKAKQDIIAACSRSFTIEEFIEECEAEIVEHKPMEAFESYQQWVAKYDVIKPLDSKKFFTAMKEHFPIVRRGKKDSLRIRVYGKRKEEDDDDDEDNVTLPFTPPSRRASPPPRPTPPPRPAPPPRQASPPPPTPPPHEEYEYEYEYEYVEEEEEDGGERKYTDEDVLKFFS